MTSTWIKDGGKKSFCLTTYCHKSRTSYLPLAYLRLIYFNLGWFSLYWNVTCIAESHVTVTVVTALDHGRAVWDWNSSKEQIKVVLG